MAIPAESGSTEPQLPSSWVCSSNISSEFVDQSAHGHYRYSKSLEVVLSRGTSLELFQLTNKGLGPSICSQTVYGTTLDIKTLPVKQLLEKGMHLEGSEQACQDLLLLLTDSGLLTVLAFSSYLNRFFVVQEVHLTAPGLDPSACSQQITVSPCGTAVAVTSCQDSLALMQVAPQGPLHLAAELRSTSDSIQNLGHCASFKGVQGSAWRQAEVLSLPPVWYRTAGGPLMVPTTTTTTSVADIAGLGLSKIARASLGGRSDRATAMADDESLLSWVTACEDGGGHSVHSVDSLGGALGAEDELTLLPPSVDAPQRPEGGGVDESGGMVVDDIVAGEGNERQGDSGGFTIWDVVFLGRTPKDGSVYSLLALTHRPNATHSDLTLLSWHVTTSTINHVARLQLPHSSALGLPVAIRHVPGSDAGVIILGTTSILPLDCISMCQRQLTPPHHPASHAPATISLPTRTFPITSTQRPSIFLYQQSHQDSQQRSLADLATEMDEAWMKGGSPPQPPSVPALVMTPLPSNRPAADTNGAVPSNSMAPGLQHARTEFGVAAGAFQAELPFHMLGPYAEMVVSAMRPWICNISNGLLQPPSGLDATDLEAPATGVSDGDQAAAAAIPAEAPKAGQGTDGVAGGSGTRAAGQRPHVALCSTWLPAGGAGTGTLQQAGEGQGPVQTLLLASSSGQHMCLDVWFTDPSTQASTTGSHEDSRYEAMLPCTSMHFAMRPIAWSGPLPLAAASHLHGVPTGHVLYKQSTGSLHVYLTPITTATPTNTTDSINRRHWFPAVRVTPCITPEAQWAASYFSWRLSQEAARHLATAGVTASLTVEPCGACQTNPAQDLAFLNEDAATPGPANAGCHLQFDSSLPADGVTHDFVMSDIMGSGRIQAFVATAGIRGGGTLPRSAAGTSAARVTTPKQLGQLTGQVQELHVRDTPVNVLSSWDAGRFPPTSGMWAVRGSAFDAQDQFLVISFLAATRVLSLGNEMSDITDQLGVSAGEATVVAGLVQDQLMAQVTPTAVILLPLEHISSEQPEPGPSHPSAPASTSMQAPATQAQPAPTPDALAPRIRTDIASGASPRVPSKISRLSPGAGGGGTGRTCARTGDNGVVGTGGVATAGQPQAGPACAERQGSAQSDAGLLRRVTPDFAGMEAEAVMMEAPCVSQTTPAGGSVGMDTEEVSSSAASPLPPRPRRDAHGEGAAVVRGQSGMVVPGLRAASSWGDGISSAGGTDTGTDGVDGSLASALQVLAVESGTDDGGLNTTPGGEDIDSRYPLTRAASATAPATALHKPPAGPGNHVARHLDVDPCVWRPGRTGMDPAGLSLPMPASSDVPQRAEGLVASRSAGAGVAGRILTAAVAIGCVVIYQVNSHELQVLSVTSGVPSGSTGSGGGGGLSNSSTGSGVAAGPSAARKRRRQAFNMRLEGAVPIQNEVSCMQLDSIPAPLTCLDVPYCPGQSAYLLIVGHRQPGTTLMQLIITPGQGIAVTTLCNAPTPALPTRAWGNAPLSSGHRVAPPSAVVPHSLLLQWASSPTSTTTQQQQLTTTHHHWRQGSAGFALPTTVDLPTPTFATGPGTGPAPAVTRAMGQAQQVVVQWLVGFRQGGLALYQWATSRSSTAPEQGKGELLWTVEFGCTSLTLSFLNTPPTSPHQAWWPPHAHSKLHGSGITVTANNLSLAGTAAPFLNHTVTPTWPSVVVVGDMSWLVRVSNLSNRITWKQLCIDQAPLTLACPLQFPAAALKSYSPERCTHGKHIEERHRAATERAPTARPQPVLLTVHMDTSWRLVAVADGCSQDHSLQYLSADQAWARHLVPTVTTANELHGQGVPLVTHVTGESSRGENQGAREGEEDMAGSDDSVMGEDPGAMDGLGDGGERGSWAPAASSVEPVSILFESDTGLGGPQEGIGTTTGPNYQETTSLGVGFGAAGAGGEDPGGEADPLSLEGWATHQMLPHPGSRSLVVLGHHPLLATGQGQVQWTVRGEGPVEGPVQHCVVACDPDTGKALGTYQCPVDEQPIQMTLWNTCASHFAPREPPGELAPGGEDVREGLLAEIERLGRLAAVLPGPLAAPMAALTASLPVATAAMLGGATTETSPPALSVVNALETAMQVLKQSLGVDGRSKRSSSADKADPLLVIAFSTLPSPADMPTRGQRDAANTRRLLSIVRVFRLLRVGSQVGFAMLTSVRFQGLVGAVCAPGPKSLVLAVGRRLACLIPKRGQLIKLGWVATRTPITQMSACESTQIIAASDGATGVTVYLCDPACEDPRAALRVIASDTVARPITTLCLLPDEGWPSPTGPFSVPQSTGGLADHGSGQSEGGAGSSESPHRSGPVLQVQSDGQGNLRWTLQTQEPAAPVPEDAPAAAAAALGHMVVNGAGPSDSIVIGAGEDIMPVWRRRALMVEAPVTVVCGDACGCVSVLRAEPLTRSPVRNLREAGVLHLADVCCRAAAVLPASSGRSAGSSRLRGKPAPVYMFGAPASMAAAAAVGVVTAPMQTWSAGLGFGEMGGGLEDGLGAGHMGVEVCLAGASGAVYRLRCVGSGAAVEIMWALEACLATLPATRPISGCTHERYRGSYTLDDVQRYTGSPTRGVLDGDLLEQFLDLPWTTKRVVTQHLFSSSKRIHDVLSRPIAHMLSGHVSGGAVGTVSGAESAWAAGAQPVTDSAGLMSVTQAVQETAGQLYVSNMVDAATMLLTYLTQQVLYQA